MKTLKLAMVAALITCAMVSLASREEFKAKPKLIVATSFEQAMKDPGLVLAMRQQLNPSFLTVEKPVYMVYVRYHSTFYRITGSREQWLKFFINDPRLPSKARINYTES
jgi:hypothetical protein